MKLKNLSFFDVKNHFRRNSSLYLSYVMFCLLGIVFGIFVAIQGEHYISLLSSENKILYSFINGTAASADIFWRSLLKFALPMVLIFLLSLNFYSGLLSFLFLAYQSALLVLSCASLISVFGISGALNSIFVIVPINLLYLIALVCYCVILLERSMLATKYRHFAYGFDGAFWIKVAVCFGVIFVITIISTILYPLFLKNAIFIVY